MFCLIYIVDLLILGNNPPMEAELIRFLQSKFAIKNLGLVKYFLVIEFNRRPGYLELSQRKYIHELLRKASMGDSKGVSTPASPTL